MARVEAVTPGMFDDVYPLLREFPGQGLSREDWRRMLFDLPWPVEEPHRGFALREDGTVVGFLGTIFSTRRVHGRRERFCNLSSWFVKDSHRASSLELVLPVLGMRDHTIVNLTASPAAHEIFRGLGFDVLEREQILVPPLTDPMRAVRALGGRVLTDPRRLMSRLDDDGRELAEHMSGTRAAQAVIGARGRWAHVIATASPWRGRWRLAHVQHASDWEVFWELLPLAAWAFFRRLGTLGLRVDARWASGPPVPFARRKVLGLPTLYRPSHPRITPLAVDGLYSELVAQPWSTGNEHRLAPGERSAG